MNKVIVSEKEVGIRLDKALSAMYPEYSRSALEKLIETGQILLNGEPVKTKRSLREGDEITVNFTELTRAVDEIELPILYEDENVVVINKPIGILSHSKGTFNKEGTVATWLRQHVTGEAPLSTELPSVILSEVEGSNIEKQSGVISTEAEKSGPLNPAPDLSNVSALSEVERFQDNKAAIVIPAQAGTSDISDQPDLSTNAQDDETSEPKNFWASNRAGIVHRLDRGTSGVMICAKNDEAVNKLGNQFSERKVKKTYLAVISGELSLPEGKIDVPIERNPKKPATFRAGINGKVAQTNFRTTQTNGAHSLIELSPKTGRTHQLRVHLDYLKHPIVGDEFYNGEKAERLMLHAAQLEITIPGSKRMTFEAPIPEEFNTLTS